MSKCSQIAVLNLSMIDSYYILCVFVVIFYHNFNYKKKYFYFHFVNGNLYKMRINSDFD